MKSNLLPCRHEDETRPHCDKFTEQLVSEIINDYFNARRPIVPAHKISRGISRVVSSYAEERLAYWCVQTFGEKIDHIYVDQDLWDGPEHLARPDLVVTSKTNNSGEATIRVLVDVKMDLGHCRDTLAGKANGKDYGLAGKANELMKKARAEGFDGAQISTLDKDGKKKKSDTRLKFSEKCIYIFVVVSGLNIGSDRKVEVENRFADCVGEKPLVYLVTMLPHTHPNDRAYFSETDAKDQLLRDLKCGNFDDFKELVRRALS